MNIICSDLEGVFIPEVWLTLAEKTGIKELNISTRDIESYDELMSLRLKIMKKHNLKLNDIINVVNSMEPFNGALEFADWIRKRAEFIILSDTFIEFIKPLIEKLNNPTIFCHYLSVAKNGTIEQYHLRQQNQKENAIRALQSLNYKTIAFGDSYNDITMLKKADRGIFFRPPNSIANEFPEIQVTKNYEELKKIITEEI